MRVLVTGGAGYIGSFTTRLLLKRGHDVVAVDNISSGYIQAIEPNLLIRGDFTDTKLMQSLIKRYDIEVVMHFAAFTGENQSDKEPRLYYQNNVIKTLKLLNIMLELKVVKFIFSSSAAFYDTTEKTSFTLSEEAPFKPLSCYARAKLAVEYALEDFRRAYGMGYASLRYFNAAGGSPDGKFGEDHQPETHLIPIVLQVPLGKRDEVLILGNDFDTYDGTAIRDYVHVDDIAEAHVLAMEKLESGKALIYNIGMGKGSSVLDVICAAEKVSGKIIPTRIAQRRPNDCAVRVANSEKIKHELGWKPHYNDLESIIETAWAWHSSHPGGYSKDSGHIISNNREANVNNRKADPDTMQLRVEWFLKSFLYHEQKLKEHKNSLSPKEAAKAIADIFLSSSVRMKGPLPPDDEYAEMQSRLELTTQTGEPIPALVQSGGSKTFGYCPYPDPDLAEFLALEQLVRINNMVRAVYKPGLKIRYMIADTYYSYVYGYDDTVEPYRTGIENLFRALDLATNHNITPIRYSTLVQAFGEDKIKERCEENCKLLQEYWDTGSQRSFQNLVDAGWKGKLPEEQREFFMQKAFEG